LKHFSAMNPLFLMVMLYSVAEASAETTQSVEIVAANPSHDTTEEKPEGSVLSAPLVSRRRYLASMCQQFMSKTWYRTCLMHH